MREEKEDKEPKRNQVEVRDTQQIKIKEIKKVELKQQKEENFKVVEKKRKSKLGKKGATTEPIQAKREAFKHEELRNAYFRKAAMAFSAGQGAQAWEFSRMVFFRWEI
jgi:hypothetical protein